MNTVDVSLVTYAYNDGHFVDGLLADVMHWTVRPQEIVVMDDGSVPAYRLPQCAVPVRLLRRQENQGIPRAKHEAISAGVSSFLLAMDCDARVGADWLELCLPQARRPEVGLVSGPVEYLSGDDLVSRFQRCFGDNHNLEGGGVTDFVPGNVFLLRRAVWEACGGMQGFVGDVCEDHFLCNRIKEMGLSLWIEARARAKQIRRINRLAMLQRYWRWCHIPVKRRAMESDDIPGYVLVVLAMPLAERLEVAIAREEPMFLYLEAVYLSYCVLDLLDHCISQGKADVSFKAAWWAELSRIFAGYPMLWALLRSDLDSLGQTPVLGSWAGGDNPFAPSLAGFDVLRPTKAFDWISRQGIAAMLADDKARRYDFSFYEAGSGRRDADSGR